jgi:iron complex transport system substrate-binding protein
MRNLIILSLLFLSTQTFSKEVKGIDGVAVNINSPKKIITLNATTTEIVYALGKGDLIVAVDNSANFPEAATKLTRLGHPYRPSVEGMVSLKPELIIATEDTLPEASREQLRTAKIQVLVLETSYKDGLDGLKRRISLIGDALDAKEQALKLNNDIDNTAKALAEKVAKLDKKKKVFFLYAHGQSKGFIYGRDTGSHQLIELAGATNAADFTTGTKPLTAEAMVQASPEAIIMLGRGLTAVGGLDNALTMPGVPLTPAGRDKKVFQVDDSIRWIGPRFIQFADQLFEQLYGKNERQ